MHHNQVTKPISLALREPGRDLIVSIEATKEYLNALWLRDTHEHFRSPIKANHNTSCRLF